MIMYRFDVSSTGTFSMTLPARNAIAIHVNAMGTGSGSSTISVNFQETATTVYGEVR